MKIIDYGATFLSIEGPKDQLYEDPKLLDDEKKVRDE